MNATGGCSAGGESQTRGKTACIVEAARGVFLDTGYGAATVDAIAATAGVSKATIYTRFSSKQAMFAAVIEQECLACSKRMVLVEAKPEPDLCRALHQMADTLLDIILLPRNLAILRLVIAEFPRFPELGSVLYGSGPAVTLKNMTSFVQRRMDAGELQAVDAATAAQHFISLLRGDLQWRALLEPVEISSAARSKVAEEAVATFLRLYAAPAGSRP